MIELKDILQARLRIEKHLNPSPVVRYVNDTFKARSILLKLENMHTTGSFKERGAINKLSQLTQDNKCEQVVASSAGNHSQAVSFHAKKMGIKVHMFMPSITPTSKILATQKWGARVLLEGENFSKALDAGLRFASKNNLPFVHAFDDPWVMAGQGTCGLELMDYEKNLDYVFVPVGGGGLASGLCVAIKEQNPNCKIIGVQALACNMVQRAFKGEELAKEEHFKPTIGDGIAIKTLGEHTLPVLKKYMDDMVSVTDTQMALAMMELLEKNKILTEGAGAAALAALLSNQFDVENKNVALIVSGGNVDMPMLTRIIKRGMVKQGRLVRIRVMISDRPGGLGKLATELANMGASVVQIYQERASQNIPFFETDVELRLEVRGKDHLDKILAELLEHGYDAHEIAYY